MSSSGAEYVRNLNWMLRMDPISRDGRLRAPNAVIEHIKKEVDSQSPTSVIIYEASMEKATSSS